MHGADPVRRKQRAPARLRLARSTALPRGEVLVRTLAGDPPLEYYVYLPRRASPRPRVLALVHGISELPRQHVERFSHLGERHGVVLVAPHFARERFHDYQRLGRSGRGARADAALDRLLDEVGRCAPARTGRVFLFGYSGGGQFVHRYAMAHPARVAAAVVCSAGWYTHPDRARRYPHGIRGHRDLPGVRFEPDAFLRVPMLVTVGEGDVARDTSLRQTDAIDRQQGRNRVERAERWADAMRRAAAERGLPAPVTLRRLADVGHSFTENADRGELAELAFDYLFDQRPEAR